MKGLATLFFILVRTAGAAQPSSVQVFTLFGDVTVTVDAPLDIRPQKETLVVLYALPNGNTTAQTMGKRLGPGEDWHFDIQHIRAQTEFLRRELPEKNIAVVYLENSYKSWPQWKTKHPGHAAEVQRVVDTVFGLFGGKKSLCLNGHSGGGRFIFSYLDGLQTVPSFVKNISFLDSNYGYDSAYLPKLVHWLHQNREARLNVFAYNDSVALLNGKRFVSDTGGTWYRSRLMLRHLALHTPFQQTRDDGLQVYASADKRVRFFLKTNPDRKIYHTEQVERNGFIHSVLAGTKEEEKRYRYFGERAYEALIR